MPEFHLTLLSVSLYNVSTHTVYFTSSCKKTRVTCWRNAWTHLVFNVATLAHKESVAIVYIHCLCKADEFKIYTAFTEKQYCRVTSYHDRCTHQTLRLNWTNNCTKLRSGGRSKGHSGLIELQNCVYIKVFTSFERKTGLSIIPHCMFVNMEGQTNYDS